MKKILPNMLASEIESPHCPKCSSPSKKKHGMHLGIQRYMCKDCGKTFKATVNSPLHWVHDKSKMNRYLHAMELDISIRKAAGILGISVPTSFYWRHKLSKLQEVQILE
jgi:transposase-like protein